MKSKVRKWENWCKFEFTSGSLKFSQPHSWPCRYSLHSVWPCLIIAIILFGGSEIDIFVYAAFTNLLWEDVFDNLLEIVEVNDTTVLKTIDEINNITKNVCILQGITHVELPAYV